MEAALYGPGGFFRRADGPAAHFRTSVHASPLFARAMVELLRAVDDALGRPAVLDLVDVGAGHGELLTGMLAAAPPELAARVRAYAVERAERPPGLPERITWTEDIPEGITGLLIANEWLDNVPLDIAEVDDEGILREVEVNTATGEERLGRRLGADQLTWLHQWWPVGSAPQGREELRDQPTPDPHLPPAGTRAELGAPRDAAWSDALRRVARGLAAALDYAHTAATRPPYGTLAAYRQGRATHPVPDGSCDLTCHVALDSALDAAARRHPGTVHTLWTTQRDALRALGVSGARPPLALASSDPAAYVRALAAAGEAAELTDPAGLGGFTWGVQTVGIPLPPILTS
jgi:SAM-dependent MidA family methyltransferase